MKIVIKEDISFSKYGLSMDIIKRIRESFTYENPLYIRMQKLGKRCYGIPKNIELLSEAVDRYHMPRGVLRQLVSIIDSDLSFDDQTVTNPVEFPQSNLELRDYQKDALKSLLNCNQGLLVSPCGSGKTEIGISLIKERSQKTLILTHTKDLLSQWETRIQERLGVNPGVITAGKWNDREAVTVATIQSLQSGLSPDFTSQFGTIVLDEAHHAPARTFSDVINQFPGRYRYGLTATPGRADRLEFLMHATFGRILNEIKTDEIAGHTVRPAVKVIETATYFPAVDSYNDLLAGLFQDEARNQLIIKQVSKEAGAGHSCLVLSQRISHIKTLQSLLNEHNPAIKTAVITGHESSAYRNESIEKARNGEIQVIFSCRIADEGLDIPRLDRLFLTAPIRSTSRLTQQVGRIRRPFPGKTGAIIYDFVDPLISLAKSQSYTRINLYKNENFRIERFSYGS
jgi:superfamily II DNA or RNA helicase